MTEVEKEAVRTDFGEIFDYADENSGLSISIPHETSVMESVNAVTNLKEGVSEVLAPAWVNEFTIPWNPDFEKKIIKITGKSPDEFRTKAVESVIAAPFDSIIDIMKENEEWQFWNTNYPAIQVDVPADFRYHFGDLDCGRFNLSLGADKPKFAFDFENMSANAEIIYGFTVNMASPRDEQTNYAFSFEVGTNFNYTYSGGIDTDTRSIGVRVQKTQNGNRKWGGYGSYGTDGSYYGGWYFEF